MSRRPRLFHQSSSPERGVTLIEACTVTAVAAVLASTAAPGFQSLIDARRLDGTAQQLATDLQFIRTASVARNQSLRISFHLRPGGSCYVIHTGSASQCSCQLPGPAICGGSAVQLKTVAIADTDHLSLQANVASMLFDPADGTVSPTGTWKLIGSNSRAVHHVVNIMGRVRSCSPQALVPGYAAC